MSKVKIAQSFSALIKETTLILLFAFCVYFFLVLFSFDQSDSSWSSIASKPFVNNLGGVFGAYLSNILFFFLGLTSWWIIVFLSYAILILYRSKKIVNKKKINSNFLLNILGLLIILLTSSALEFLRFSQFESFLPEGYGGVIGEYMGTSFERIFGNSGSILLLLLFLAIGITLFFKFSWISFIERIGFLAEKTFISSKHFFERWGDRKAGQIATIKRMSRIGQVKQIFQKKDPLKISGQTIDIKKSERVIKEKQKPLFDELPDSELPPIHLLDAKNENISQVSRDTIEYTSRLIEKKLIDFGIEVKVVAAQPGPVVTRFEIELATGVKGSQIINLSKDLARALSVGSIRVVETIPGKTYMGLEIPNQTRQIVRISEIFSSQTYANLESPLALALGKDIAGKPVITDLSKMPHLLVAGTTGSGKSVAINAMILSLLYKATIKEIRLILIDPKMLELSVYEGIPHLLTPVVTDMKEASHALNWCVAEMDRRYKLMSEVGVRNLSGFNSKVRDATEENKEMIDPLSADKENPDYLKELPLIVVVIDELADLIMVVGKKVEELIARLAQKARAAGLHLILATQRPSVDVITGLIKANIPTRISFQVSSKVDSRTILDQMGAEQLLGQGDMLYLPPGTGYPQRVHGAFVSDDEVNNVVEFLKSKGEPQFMHNILKPFKESVEGQDNFNQDLVESDPLYDQAVQVVLNAKRASISLVQRNLRIGYNRAARLIEQMEKSGIVSSMSSSGSREILVKSINDD